MESFTVNHLVVLLVVFVASAGVLLLLLWPTVRSGARVLRNWGVAEPTSEQARVARRYLRQRRVLYVLFIILAGPLSGLAVLAIGRSYFPYVGWFLTALLLAELIAMLRPVRGEVRVATLERRGIGDVLPLWMIVVHLVTAAAATVSVIVLAGDPDLGGGVAPVWVQVLVVVVSAAAVYAVAWFAVARPAVGDAQVDRALRLRSARVTMALGTMFAATLLAGSLNVIGGWVGNGTVTTLGYLAQSFGLVMWALMASVFAFRSGLRGQLPARNG